MEQVKLANKLISLTEELEKCAAMPEVLESEKVTVEMFSFDMFSYAKELARMQAYSFFPFDVA